MTPNADEVEDLLKRGYRADALPRRNVQAQRDRVRPLFWKTLGTGSVIDLDEDDDARGIDEDTCFGVIDECGCARVQVRCITPAARFRPHGPCLARRATSLALWGCAAAPLNQDDNDDGIATTCKLKGARTLRRATTWRKLHIDDGSCSIRRWATIAMENWKTQTAMVV